MIKVILNTREIMVLESALGALPESEGEEVRLRIADLLEEKRVMRAEHERPSRPPSAANIQTS